MDRGRGRALVRKLLLQASITERHCPGRVGRPSISLGLTSDAAGDSLSEHVTSHG